jgi:predicted dehydrogenase
MAKPLKVGIVGMGGIGNTHGPVYMAHPDAELVAVCDIIKERADKAAETYGVKAFYSIQEMLDSGITLDACSMTTAGIENGGDHYQATMELLGAGIPVLGEKPISNELDKAKEMVALAKEKNLRYAINLNHRFTPAALRAKEWATTGRLGTLHMMNMTMWINNPNESSPWFHLRALHPHSFDVIQYFMGPVKSVQAFLMKGEGRTIWSNAQVNLLFESGAIGHLTGSYDAGGAFGLERAEVTGSEGMFIIDDACENLTFKDRRSIQTESYGYLGAMAGFGETFPSRIGRWIEQNVAEVDPTEIDASGKDALGVQTVIEAAIRSWNEKKVIDTADM